MTKFKIGSNTTQILTLAILILLVRIIYIDLYNHFAQNAGYTLYSTIFALLSDYLSLAIMIVATVFCTIRVGKNFPYGKYPTRRTLLIFFLLFVIAVFIAILANRNLMLEHVDDSVKAKIFISFLAALLINTIVMIFTDLVIYFYQSHNALKLEKDKKHKAQYQYTQLKQQLNPHFLINSLSLLDYLVQSNETERASAFIKKLAKVYRYLLHNESEKLVTLDEELKFIDSYASLLSERFVDGIYINVDVADEYRLRQIVPCGLQILVENATKHNVVNKEQPLNIHIFAENDMIIASNNLQPRISKLSMGIGLENLRKQYSDVSNTKIEIVKTETEFIVKLPLI